PRRRGLPLLPLLLLVLAASAAYVAAPFATRALAGDRVMDGVSLQGEPVGGLARHELRARLERRYAAFLRAPVTLTFEGRTWRPTLEQLGASLNLERAAAEALAAGRRGDPLRRVDELWLLYRGGGLDVAPRLTVDARALQHYLTGLAAELEQPPQDAALSIAAGRVLPTPARQGRQLLVDETAIDVLRALQNLTPQTVVLRTRVLAPALSDEDIAGAVADARLMLAGPLTLRQGERSWTWEVDRVAELLAVAVADGHMTVDVDQQRLERAVEKLAQVVDSPSVEPRVAFRNGRLRIVAEGRTGLRLDQPATVAALRAALRTREHTLELPVEPVTPQITAETLPELGITELLAEGRSSFAGSANYRVTNIKAGAARMDGVLIPPGAEFSFNTQLGAVDESNGFVQGYAVIGNRTQLEWGGGVCQVSTTVFRAAFWAGLPFTERHAHPFYISWYDEYSFPDRAGPGMDATIFTGVLDLRFVNDTGHWLLMEAEADTERQVLTVRLYGTNPGRTVRAVGPEISNEVPPPAQAIYVTDPGLPAGTVKQTDRARRGMDITVYRAIEQGGQQKPPELFFTRFKAWPDVFVRGTGP
ncbi:MAG TPA: VanW family protein, partial [Roseiflexaceae bacterium]|nr:VanW family protein [Roseiflexaceae bacterium]